MLKEEHDYLILLGGGGSSSSGNNNNNNHHHNHKFSSNSNNSSSGSGSSSSSSSSNNNNNKRCKIYNSHNCNCNSIRSSLNFSKVILVLIIVSFFFSIFKLVKFLNGTSSLSLIEEKLELHKEADLIRSKLQNILYKNYKNIITTCIMSHCCNIDSMNNKGINDLIEYNFQFDNINDKQILQSLHYSINTTNPIIFFQILNNTLYSVYNKEAVWSYRYSIIASEILLLLDKFKLPNVIFPLYLTDGIGDGEYLYRDMMKNRSQFMPFFVLSRDAKMKVREMFPLFPDDYTIGDGDINNFYFGGIEVKLLASLKFNNISFEQKMPKIVWRGKNTGNGCRCEASNFTHDCFETPKYAMVQLTKKYKFIDAEFAAPEHVILFCDRLVGTSSEKVLYDSGLSHYKYLMSIDGIRSTFPGLLLKLYLNSVVFKINGSSINPEKRHYWEQWFYPSIEDYVYHVDSTKIVKQLKSIAKTLDDKDGKWKEKAARSRNYAVNNINICNIKQYIFQAIKKYASKMSSCNLIKKKLPYLQEVSNDVQIFKAQKIIHLGNAYKTLLDGL